MNPHNFSKFESLISCLDFQPHIIAINETWEKPHLTGQFKNLLGYIYVSNSRVISRGGGVVMYIKKNTIFSPRPKISIMHEKMFESLFINVHFEGRSLTCGTIYRPPRNDTAGQTCFFEDVNLVFNELNKT